MQKYFVELFSITNLPLQKYIDKKLRRIPLEKNFAKDSVTDYDVHLTLQDKAETKSTKLRVKGEEKKITVYVVTGEGAEEKLEIYLSVNAQYETN